MRKELISERFYHEVVMEANCYDLYSLTIFVAYNWMILFCSSIMLPGLNLACVHQDVSQLIMFRDEIEYNHSEFSDGKEVNLWTLLPRGCYGGQLLWLFVDDVYNAWVKLKHPFLFVNHVTWPKSCVRTPRCFTINRVSRWDWILSFWILGCEWS